MPRDYKHRAQKKAQKKPVPGWVWLVTGILLGGFVVGLAWIRGQSDPPGGGEWAGAKPDRPPQAAGSPARSVETPTRPKPRYEFYDTLPEMEVDVSDEPIDEPRPVTVEGIRVDGRYLLQVGSFKRTQDAERMKAQLALLGIESQVVAASVGAGDTRYRVRSGPYQGRTALERARQRLVDNGFKGAVAIAVDGR